MTAHADEHCFTYVGLGGEAYRIDDRALARKALLVRACSVCNLVQHYVGGEWKDGIPEQPDIELVDNQQFRTAVVRIIQEAIESGEIIDQQETRSQETEELTVEHTTRDTIGHLFTYHAPTNDQPVKYEQLRDAGREFALVVAELVPPGPDQSAAIRKIREAVFTANAGIATGGGFYPKAPGQTG